MVVAAMSLELRGCGNHAVWSGAGEANGTEVRFCAWLRLSARRGNTTINLSHPTSR
jgi:hypothetical protein